MKTKLIILSLSLTVAMILASCGSSKQTCPAYSKANTELPQQVKS